MSRRQSERRAESADRRPHIADKFLLDKWTQRRRGSAIRRARFRAGPLVDEGDQVYIGGGPFDILKTGHCRAAWYFTTRKCILPMFGDVLFNGSVGRMRHSRGRSRHADQVDYEKLLPLGDDVGSSAAHGPGSSSARSG